MRFIQSVGCLLTTVVLILVLIIGATVGLAAYGYSQLDTEFEATEYSPELDISIGSIAGAIFDVFKGDLLGAAASIIKGININGTLTISNRSFVPLYLPAMKHRVSIEGKDTERVVETEAMWVGPNSKEVMPFNMMVASRDLPQVALNALAKGGTVDVTIVSEIPLGAFSITRTSHRQETISKSLSSYTKERGSGSQPSVTPTPPPVSEAPSVTFHGWYISGNKASVVTKTEEVTARVSLSGGSAGAYKLRIRRDIRLASDETVRETSFAYDGISATKELTFVLPYATDETSTDGYHMDVMKDGYIVWTLADAYPPRLRVAKPTTTYSLSMRVNPAGAGSVSLNPSGGIYSSGTKVTLTATAYPGFQFASWSGDFSGTNPIITITMSSNKDIVANFAITGPLSVSFNGWYVGGIRVDTTTKGSTVVARIVVSGGSSGQYRMRIRRDIVWADDQTVKELTFNHDGTPLTRELSFTPPYATGEASTDGYHIDLIKDGYIVWTLTDAYPPRLRVTQ